MTWHVPDIALSRFGDSEKTKHLRLQRREEFLVDDRGRRSVVDEPVYHGTLADFHFPVFEVMDLGMHFGTMDAALEVMQREREDNARRAKDRGDRPDTGSHMGKYYINIKNPLILNTDLIQWRSPYSWYEHTFNYEVPLLELADKKTGKRFDEKSGLTMFDREGVSPLVDKQWKSFITKWNERLPNDKLRDMEFDKGR